ncbi:cytochrome P450 2J1-like [Haliotis rubra]|uniref:cytochrome P450 2J1-like n=1 Tax=Haliotis rubra TaxID=36100 RepID=UPI001EE5F359|nr:cytochrome P450 2J1-like [Haliotis rubra]
MVDIFAFSPTTVLLCVAVLVLLWLLTRRPSGLPPGPPLLPFLGNVLSMSSDPRITFRRLRQRYGDIFSVYLFNKPLIVLNGYSTLKEAIVKNADVFSERPHTTLNDFIARGKGVVATSGELWREQRRFALNTLREFGAGRNIMEDKIHEEISQFIEAFEAEGGQGFDCKRLVCNAVSNVICSTVFGKRFEYTDPLFYYIFKSHGRKCCQCCILEDKIHEEISQFIEAFEAEGGQGFDCKRLVCNAVSNVICSTVFGKRFEYTDPLFITFLKAMDENVANVGAAGVLNVLPIVRFLPGDLFKFKKTMQNVEKIESLLIDPMTEEHLKNHDDDNVDDFIHAYIKEMRLRKAKQEDTTLDYDIFENCVSAYSGRKASVGPCFSENLKKVIADLFVAGTETTATTIRWTMIYLLNNPEIQERCFREIQENIGQSRLPSMKDKTSLPYMEATIMEVLRRADIAPTALPHTVPHDVQFRGYTFPKGVQVIAMLDSVLQDPDVWGDPDNFRPDRFLDASGKIVKKDEFIPFSLGRRVCLGEAMARMELFLFLTTMIQRFKFIPVDGQMPSLDGTMGITNSPRPFVMKAIPRV